MFTYSTVTSKGQAVIPKAIRDQFGIQPRSRVGFGVQKGKIVVDVIPSIQSLRGIIKTKVKLSDAELKKAIEWSSAVGAAEDYLKTLNLAEKKVLKERLKKSGLYRQQRFNQILS